MKLFDHHSLLENVRGYVQTQIELVKVEAQEKVQEVIKRTIIIIVWVLLAMAILLFLFIALALYLNQVLESHYVGFLIVAGIGVLIGLILLGVWKYFESQAQKENEQTKQAKSWFFD